MQIIQIKCSPPMSLSIIQDTALPPRIPKCTTKPGLNCSAIAVIVSDARLRLRQKVSSLCGLCQLKTCKKELTSESSQMMEFDVRLRESSLRTVSSNNSRHDLRAEGPIGHTLASVACGDEASVLTPLFIEKFLYPLQSSCIAKAEHL